jgi:hypothetical protein
VSVAEVHDASAFGEGLQTEMVGFCEIGAGGKLAESGATTLGGSIPSTRRAAWSPRVTRWERPGSLRSMNSLDSFAVRAERARYPARALPLPRMAVGGGRYVVDGVGRQ